MKLYEVAVAAPLYTSLTYGQPAGVKDDLPSGIRVLVPLGNRLVTGYLLGSAPSTGAAPDPSFVVKPIVDLLDPDPLFPADLVPLFRWIADYYHYPLGEVIRTALPGGLVARSGREVILTDSGRENLPGELKRLKKRGAWMDRLLDRGRLSPGSVNTVWRKPTMQRLLKKWQQNKWVAINEVLVQPGIRAKSVTMISLTPELRKRVEDAGSAPKAFFVDSLKKSEQKTLELLFHSTKKFSRVPRPELTRQYPGAGRALHSLAARGLVTMEEQRCYRDPFGNVPPFFPRPENLSAEQKAVLAELVPAIVDKRFQPFLLHGVTGCGKTEVYLQAAEQCLDRGGTVLLLVPEIALASQLEAHFYSRFGDLLAVLHSGLSAGERFDQWQQILEGKARIVIGARSAVFAPLENLGLVIVDEEHESAYKQDDGLRYNGRDIAVLRARFVDCPILLGSATPSVTSYYHACSTKNKKYQLLTMPNRVNDQPLPPVEIVDLGKQKRSRPDLFFSDRLIAALKENMDKRLQSLLFVNRRGYSPFMLCRDCGHIVQCRHCRVSLTLHRSSNRLTCHYCGYSTSPKIICPQCRSGELTGLGVGSERIEEEVQQLIPHARTARLDSDTTADRKKYLAILEQVRNQEVDILIGTQMVAKGLHFPKMTLVGVIWADSGLGMPDYKASERTFQLLTQVTGRAGRDEHPGRVIIQTNQPEHYAVELARNHDYLQLYEQELGLRRDLGYPPFGRLINIGFSGEVEERVSAAAGRVGSYLRRAATGQGIEILGPAPAPLSMINKRYRWQLLLKSSYFSNMHRLCALLLQEKNRLCRADIRLSIDVDPENMM